MDMVTKKYAPEFEKYMQMIIHCSNYDGMPCRREKDGTVGWVATANSKIGKERQEWIDKKAKELGITGPSKNAKVAFAIHPTKEKVCQICGKKMSLRYIYPNRNFVKYLEKRYDYDFNRYDSIFDVIKYLRKSGINDEDIKNMLIKHAKLSLNEMENKSIDEIINTIEKKCRNSNLKMFGPGAMSDWPDRFDGYHSYNRCCRKREDKGRSDSNLKSYTKDRRAYEYWSDGNIVAANKFMGSKYFDGVSADHIGPISLGFIHDPHFLQRMSGSANSSKRDKLKMDDFNLIKEKEKKYRIKPISWFASDIWSKMETSVCNDDDLKKYRTILKQNMNAYMECLWIISSNTDDGKGDDFLTRVLLKPKESYFRYNYHFNSINGSYDKTPKKVSKQLNKEYERYLRVSFQSVEDYHNKNNRHIKSILNKQEKQELSSLCKKINTNVSDPIVFNQFVLLNKSIQHRLLRN